MREILFRGKRKDNNEWVYGGWFSVDHENYIITNCDNVPVFDLWGFAEEVILETVGQFTGLTDKNGKKIFEGDILNSKYGLTYKIGYLDGCFVFQTKRTRKCNYALCDSQFGIAYKNVCDCDEVIGNIHDNPELLKGQENE